MSGFKEDLSVAYALVAAYETGLLDHLAQSRTLDELVAAGFDRSVTKNTLWLLCVAGHVRISPDGVWATDSAEVLEHAEELADAAKLWRSLTPSLITGPMHVWSSAELEKRDAGYAAKVASFHDRFRAAAHALSQIQGDAIPGNATVLDIGAGSGVWSYALLHARGAARTTLVDLPAVCDVALELAAEEGLGPRVTALPGDFLTCELPQSDVVLVANVLRILTAEDKEALLKRAAAAVVPGGSLIVVDVTGPDFCYEPERASYRLHLSLRTANCGTPDITSVTNVLEDCGMTLWRSRRLPHAPLGEYALVYHRPTEEESYDHE